MLRVKGQDGFLPIGPAVLTTDEWTPDDGYTLVTRVNGESVQEADESDLIWDYRYQLADLSRLITLEPGDVVLTGTPANSRPVEPGDVVEVEISGMPALRNPIEEWDVDLSGPGEQPEISANTLHVALAIPEEEAARIYEESRP
jgi:5-oxopent-3-ene-1,2,5-tricarboxylate decarboxylase/2-hydroxyhepta-2,4-diene-1,7-dioate isomerase